MNKNPEEGEESLRLRFALMSGTGVRFSRLLQTGAGPSTSGAVQLTSRIGTVRFFCLAVENRGKVSAQGDRRRIFASCWSFAIARLTEGNVGTSVGLTNVRLARLAKEILRENLQGADVHW